MLFLLIALTFAGSFCNDGTYSDSEGQGTCSYHGGVKDTSVYVSPYQITPRTPTYEEVQWGMELWPYWKTFSCPKNDPLILLTVDNGTDASAMQTLFQTTVGSAKVEVTPKGSGDWIYTAEPFEGYKVTMLDNLIRPDVILVSMPENRSGDRAKCVKALTRASQ